MSTATTTTIPATDATTLTRNQRFFVLLVAFTGLVGAGFQLGLMPLAALSVSRDFLGEAFEHGLAGDWFARYTAALMLGAALGGILLGSLGDKIGRARTTALSAPSPSSASWVRQPV